MSVLSLNITGSDRVTLTNTSLPAQYKSEVNTCKDTERDIKKTLKASISFFLWNCEWDSLKLAMGFFLSVQINL